MITVFIMTSEIQRKLQQKRPFSSDSQEAILGIHLAAEKLRQQMNSALRNWDITHQQYNILRILRGAGDDGLPIMKIADRMVEKAPGLTRLVDRMEKQKRVKRRHSQEDRRRVLVTITPIGLQLLDDMQETIDDYDRKCFDCLTDDERKNLILSLNKFLK